MVSCTYFDLTGVKCLRLPPRTLNLNAFAERRARSVKEECLSKLILFGDASLREALTQFQERYHTERNQEGKGNVLLFPDVAELPKSRDHQSSAASASAVFSRVLPSSGPHEFLSSSG